MDERLAELTVTELVERLATDAPAPGGGSAAALTGAIGAALVQMVVELSARRAADRDAEALIEIRGSAASLQSELLRLLEIDAAAYGSVVAARRLPKETELERDARLAQIDAAVREATRAPLATADRASAVLDLALRLAPIGSRSAVSDVGVAGELAAAAVRGALLNVEINLPSVAGDEELRAEAARAVEELRAGLPDRERRLRDAVAARLA